MDFSTLLAQWPPEKRSERAKNASPEAVDAVLAKAGIRQLAPDDFLILLSDAAATRLEELAQMAHKQTELNFGRAVNIFTPLYISDYCTNQCRYCGFNARNGQKRRHLSIEEAQTEAFAIADQGFQHILLLTGDARKLASPAYIGAVAKAIKPRFASIGVEIYAMSECEYAALIASGVDSMTMFQETYSPQLYAWLHPAGPKADYQYRLDAPTRAAAAGMRSIGLGALLGLEEFCLDAFATGLHAWWLMRNFPGVEISISIPRICPHEGDFEISHGVTDRQLAQYVAALRCFLPRAGLTCSSRESAFMRDHLVPLGITKVSAGVSTAVGGRTNQTPGATGQFEISDRRSLAEMIRDLGANGYQAVLKDWEAPVA